MGDYYRQFLSNMAGGDGYMPTSPDELNPNFMPAAAVLPMTTPPIPSPYPSHIEYFAAYAEPAVVNAPRAGKGRRRSAASQGGGNPDQVKHRRTRSGCFTCRSRRIKCDEKRPICERCRKANRECTYPDTPGIKGNSSRSVIQSNDGSSTIQCISPTFSNEGEEDDIEQEVKLETIPDDDEPDGSQRRESMSVLAQVRRASAVSLNIASNSGRQPSETPSQDGPKSVSSTVSLSTVASGCPTPPRQPTQEATAHLPQDYQMHLEFFKNNMSNYHYGLAVDEDNFFNLELPVAAVAFEPLLNALVGFAAYHGTLQNPNGGDVEDFLEYYNRAIALLAKVLDKGEMNNAYVLLTILHLGTMDEYLGDWVNLMGHQKFALEVLTKIFTPETATQSSIGRVCVSWCARFDNIVALMGGFPTQIPREWLTTMVAFYQRQMASYPAKLRWKIEDRSARLKLISYDMSILYARGNRQEIEPTVYAYEHHRLTAQLEEWKTSWDPALCDREHLITDFPWRRPLDPNDFVDPYRPGLLFDHPLFNNSVITTEWHSIVMMHKSQSPNVSPEQLSEELRGHAFAVCEMFECMEHWPELPAGALIAMQPCLAIASLFMPRQPNHNMWLRQKFALLEVQGHITPAIRRAQMAEIFGDPSCIYWWLPNGQGFSPILQSIRSLADARNTNAVNSQQENLREVRHLFDKLITG
ncbi:hypothetical protein ACQKWADRAFT_87522 [Trichoderma austrokoningii]